MKEKLDKYEEGTNRLLKIRFRSQVSADETGERTLEFLDLPPYDPDPRLVKTRVNETMGTKRSVPSKDEQALIEEYEPEVKLLKELMPDLDLSLWPRFAHLA